MNTSHMTLMYVCHFHGLNYSSPTSITLLPENDFLKTPLGFLSPFHGPFPQ